MRPAPRTHNAPSYQISTKSSNEFLSYWGFNKFLRPLFQGPNCTKFRGHGTIITAPQVCFIFQICCSVSKTGWIKGTVVENYSVQPNNTDCCRMISAMQTTCVVNVVLVTYEYNQYVSVLHHACRPTCWTLWILQWTVEWLNVCCDVSRSQIT